MTLRQALVEYQGKATRAELKVLQAIVAAQAASDPVNPSLVEISEVAGLVVSNIHKYLAALERRKLIARERKAGSVRRAYRGQIQITDRGQLVLLAAQRRNSTPRK